MRGNLLQLEPYQRSFTSLNMQYLSQYKNIRSFKEKAKEKLSEEVFDYLAGGADDMRTLNRNIRAFEDFQIRPRRLVDVRHIDTSIELFDEKWSTPILIAPVGLQGLFHPDAEIATAKAAQVQGHLMIASTVSQFPYTDIAKELDRKPWFQLYPTTNRAITKLLLQKAEENHCPVLVLTVDLPVPGNREKHLHLLTDTGAIKRPKFGNLDHLLSNETFFDPSMTWEIIPWLRDHTKMKIVLKGIMTAEDTALAIKYGVDGIIVSNHGGRQLESDLSPIECLKEIADEAKGKLPIILDGGIRRGTDIFKALALGANAVGIGRAYCYGLAAAGQAGIERVLEIFKEELVRNMRLAGTISIKSITRKHIQSIKP